MLTRRRQGVRVMCCGQDNLGHTPAPEAVWYTGSKVARAGDCLQLSDGGDNL